MISIDELKNDINWIDECSKDLFYPKHILDDLIFSLEHFLLFVVENKIKRLVDSL